MNLAKQECCRGQNLKPVEDSSSCCGRRSLPADDLSVENGILVTRGPPAKFYGSQLCITQTVTDTPDKGGFAQADHPPKPAKQHEARSTVAFDDRPTGSGQPMDPQHEEGTAQWGLEGCYGRFFGMAVIGMLRHEPCCDQETLSERISDGISWSG